MSQADQTVQDRGEQETAEKSQRKQRVNTDIEEASGSSLRPKGTQTHELQTLTHKWTQLILLWLENSQVAVDENRLQRSWGYGRFKGAVFLIYLFG